MKTCSSTILILLCLQSFIHAQNRGDLEIINNNSPVQPDAAPGIAPSEESANANLLNLRNITKSEADNDNLYKFYIPSAMLSTGLEPAATSKVKLDFGNEKVEFKYGQAFGISKKANTDLNTSWGIKVGAAAPDGARTLFEYDDTPRDYSGTTVFTMVVKDKSGSLKFNTLDGQVDARVSRHSQWMNFSLEMKNAKRSIFSSDTAYEKKYYTNLVGLITFNGFLNTWSDPLKKYRIIYSAGIGFGRFDNYDLLDNHTLRKGTIDSTGAYYTETTSVSGKKGEFKPSEGLILTGSIFKPISKPTAMTSLILGTNINYFGVGLDDRKFNINGGLYIAKRSVDEDKNELKEDFSIGLLADYARSDNQDEVNSTNEKFKVILTVQIPLRFN